jgi:serine/threonine protein phosphatase PrpC
MHARTDTSSGLWAMAVRSPMCLGREDKDQDRVYWSAATQVACVCDGVSSSPFSAQAAEIASQFSPVLLKGADNTGESLRALADLLVVRRLEAQHSPVQTPDSASEAMRAVLRDVAEERLAESFQTTLVAASFVQADDVILTRILTVGDSAFFAFGPDGELLVTSLAISDKFNRPDNGTETRSQGRTHGMRLDPGVELLVKVVCNASERPRMSEQADIRPGSAGNWLVCIPLDEFDRDGLSTSRFGHPQSEHSLGPDDLLLVPKYLTEIPADPRYQAYRRIRCFRSVRIIGRSRWPSVDLQRFSAVTAVLPDHFYTGKWSYSEERFPRQTEFLLASDGLYGCFSDPQELWQWFRTAAKGLTDDHGRSKLLRELHERRHGSQGDDDISFVWVRSVNPPDSSKSVSVWHDAKENC